MLDIYETRQNTADGSTLNMIISLENTNIEYQLAQNLAIFIENDPSIVEDLAKLLGFELDDVVTYSGLKDLDTKKVKLPFPAPIRVRDILTYFCDF